MIRVGFQPIGGAGWMGGRNYLWNLLNALSLVEDRRLQPVLLTSDGDGRELLLPGVEHFVRDGVLAGVWARRAGTLSGLVLGCNHVEQHWLRRARVDLVSHGALPLGARARLPWIYWIPDVQHRHFPDLFSRRQHWERDTAFRTALGHAAAVITSSAATRRDLATFYGRDAERVRVLHFVCSPRVEAARLPSLAELQQRLGVPARYFHLPNQFWKHKNHTLVIEALARVAGREPALTIIATGAKDDPRWPRYYDELMARIRELGLGERFRHLGMVANNDLMALMRHAVAVINPSWFEGWSSTVEEAKSTGKLILLSDIAVHREQAPARGRFFAPDRPEALAELLLDSWCTFDPAVEERALAAAAADLPGRVRGFGAAYQDIVLDVAGAEAPRR